MEGFTDWNAAKQEALEEAGIEGHIGRKIFGKFEYVKRTKNGGEKHCEVDVYCLKVFKMKSRWLEKLERTRAWFPVEDAAEKVSEAGLKAVILKLISA